MIAQRESKRGMKHFGDNKKKQLRVLRISNGELQVNA